MCTPIAILARVFVQMGCDRGGFGTRWKSKMEPRSQGLREKLFNAAWASGVALRDLARRVGLLGPLDEILAELAPVLLPAPSEEVRARLPHELQMVIPPRFPSCRSYVLGTYERQVTALFTRLVTRGMTVVDLGANLGYYTLLASRLVGAEGRVYAFEPDPEVRPWLYQNISSNNCQNAVVVDEAASSATGWAPFLSLKMHRSRLLSAPLGASTSVRTVTLDAFFGGKGWPEVHLIKMDIEGSERAALEGMSELSCRNPNLLLIMELNLKHMRRSGVTVDAMAAVLRGLGFRRGYIIEQRLKPFSIADSFPSGHTICNLLLAKD